MDSCFRKLLDETPTEEQIWTDADRFAPHVADRAAAVMFAGYLSKLRHAMTALLDCIDREDALRKDDECAAIGFESHGPKLDALALTRRDIHERIAETDPEDDERDSDVDHGEPVGWDQSIPYHLAAEQS